MELPLDIAFHGMEPSGQLDTWVRRQASKLERFKDHIIHCRVAVEARHRQPSKASVGINVEISVPGDTLVAKREGRPHAAHDHADLQGVVREAFDAAIRQLEEHLDRQRPQSNGRRVSRG